jgi:hypothetical protein
VTNLKRAEALALRVAWEHRWRWVVTEVGPSSPLLPMIGSLAWGRYEHETQPDESLTDIVCGVGYLEGMRTVALLACRALKYAPEDRALCAMMYR